MANLKVDELASAVNAILADYRDVVHVTLEKAVDITAKETVNELQNTSPEDSGEYAKSWTQKKTPWLRGAAYGRIAYAQAPHYRLTHLLEYGHDILRNGKKVGRAAAHPHIAKAEQKAIENFEKRLREGINDA